MSRIRQKTKNSLAIKKIILIIGCILFAFAIGLLIFIFIISPFLSYKKGLASKASGDYADAITCFSDAGHYKDSAAQIDECYEMLYGVSAYKTLKSLSVGSTFQFGNYEQDNNLSNGSEPIEWIVLNKNGSDIMLISRYGLDCQLYNSQYSSITWDSCTLRKWLNSDFLSNAFSNEEIPYIKDSIVFADDNPDYNTDSGKATKDKVFLLSVSECNQYFSCDEERVCVPTQYALSKNLYMDANLPGCWWWLRTPGDIQTYVSDVSGDGSVQTFGLNLCFDMCAVRPVIWLDLSKYYAE